jgi:hypothetical protein
LLFCVGLSEFIPINSRDNNSELLILKSHKLRYISSKDSEDFEVFNPDNTICGQQAIFDSTRNPFQSYHVVEFQDYEVQKNTAIFPALPSNIEFLVVNLVNDDQYIWYHSQNGSLIPFLDNETNRSQLSNVCYIDEFVFLPNPSDTKICLFVFVLTTFVLLVNIPASFYFNGLSISYDQPIMLWRRYVTLFLLLSASISLGIMVCFLTSDYGTVGVWISLWPIISNWSLTALTMCMIIHMLVKIISSKYRLNLRKYQGLLAFIFFILALIIIAGCITLCWANILGPDNASQQTGHFYVNTLIGSYEKIEFKIRMM